MCVPYKSAMQVYTYTQAHVVCFSFDYAKAHCMQGNWSEGKIKWEDEKNNSRIKIEDKTNECRMGNVFRIM